MTSLPGVQLNYRNASAGGWTVNGYEATTKNLGDKLSNELVN